MESKGGGIELYFQSKSSVELVHCRFRSSKSRQAFESHRGRNNEKSFTWSPAVRGLCTLLVKVAQAQRSCNSSLVKLSGAAGSDVRSLDYALGKSPQWMIDMFGCESNGTPTLRKLIRRFNPDGRRAGPSEVSARPALQHDMDIRVFLSGRELVDELSLQSLLAQLRAASKSAVCSSSDMQRAPIDIRAWFGQVFRHELCTTLRAWNPFDREGLQFCAQKVLSNVGYRKTVGKVPSNCFDRLLELNCSSQWIGQYQPQSLKVSRPLKVALPLSFPGSVCMFHEFQARHPGVFQLDQDFAHAVEIVDRLVSGDLEYEPDLMCLGAAPIASLQKSPLHKDYVILEMLPGNSLRVMKRKNPRKNSTAVSLMRSSPSNGLFYFEELKERGYTFGGAKRNFHAEPQETFKQFLGDSEQGLSVSHFPHFWTLAEFANCQAVTEVAVGWADAAMFLVVHKRVAENKQLAMSLRMLLRQSWLRFLQDPMLLSRSVDEVLAQPEMIPKLVNYTGLFWLNARAA